MATADGWAAAGTPLLRDQVVAARSQADVIRCCPAGWDCSRCNGARLFSSFVIRRKIGIPLFRTFSNHRRSEKLEPCSLFRVRVPSKNVLPLNLDQRQPLSRKLNLQLDGSVLDMHPRR